MFDSVKKLESKITKVAGEVADFERKMTKQKPGSDNYKFYKLKRDGAQNELSKLKGKLVLAKAKEKLKKKK